jgi:hypothetical protein
MNKVQQSRDISRRPSSRGWRAANVIWLDPSISTFTCGRHHLNSCIVHSQHHEDGAVACIRRHDAATLQYRAGPDRSGRSLPRITVAHSSHMGPDVPFTTGALRPTAESSGGAESCKPRETHAKTRRHCRMRTFTLGHHMHISMDDQPRRLQAGVERG